ALAVSLSALVSSTRSLPVVQLACPSTRSEQDTGCVRVHSPPSSLLLCRRKPRPPPDMIREPESAQAPLLILGKIVSVHGIRGAVKVSSHTQPLDNVLNYPIWILRKGQEQRQMSVISGRLQARVVFAPLKGVRDRNEALELVDWEICVPESQLPALPEGEYYWHQLEGLQVVTLDGQL